MKYTVEDICNEFAISRQSYYKARKQKEKIEDEQHNLIEKVLELRAKMPMLGCRKLYHLLKKEIDLLSKSLGRDKFFGLLKDNGLLIKPKRYRPRTTESRHRFKKYANLIKDLEINRINQVYVSDITYLRTVDRFCYLFLITDLYSRRIMGEQLSESLAIEGSLSALRMAAGKVKNLNGSIHHSDRGIQYCSNIYTDKLKSLGIKISMSEQANPYENAVAERVNGILKQEFMLDKTFPDIMTARKAVKEAIRIYNEKRPHMSLGYKTPEQVYKAQNELSTY
jgi:transposase InsO family protein